MRLLKKMLLQKKDSYQKFIQAIWIGDAQVAEKVASQVSKQVASEVLNGSRQKNMWVSPSGEMQGITAVGADLCVCPDKL